MPKNNEEIIADYQRRYRDMVGRLGPNISDKDALFTVELLHIMDSYRADPTKPLVQSKMEYTREDYEAVIHDPHFQDRFKAMMNWWGSWQPPKHTV